MEKKNKKSNQTIVQFEKEQECKDEIDIESDQSSEYHSDSTNPESDSESESESESETNLESDSKYEADYISNHDDKLNLKTNINSDIQKSNEIRTNKKSSKNKTELRKCDACIEKKCMVEKEGIFNYENGRVYCRLHNKTHPHFDKLKANNKKPCKNHNRKCKNELDIDSKSKKCDDCVDKGREKEKKRTEKNSIARKSENMCWKCQTQYDDPNEFLDTKGQKTAKCKICREKQAARDRVARSNGTKKDYPLSESAKETKKVWRENNYDKYAGYWIKYRAKQIKNMDENYWKRNSDYAKKRMDMISCEDKWVLNENKRKDTKAKLKYYQGRATRNGIIWNLTDEEAFDLFANNCFYCDIEPDEYHNGIDRVNNENEYSNKNVVSACRICNYMKGCLDMDIFIKRCEHILMNLKLINGRTYDNIFPNSICSKYEVYKNRANEKNLEFALTEEQFEEIIMQECYLCGRQSYNYHLNGIDRLYSNGGYIDDNSRTCCTECNYMKNNYLYDVFIDKLTKIYDKHKTTLDLWSNTTDYIIRSGELNLYRYSKSIEKFKRSKVNFQNIDNGLWTYKYSYDECFFEMSKELLDDEELTTEKFIINSGVHNIPYLTISQCHNESLNMENNLIPNDFNIVSITHDSTIIVKIPYQHKKIFVIVTKHDDKIKKIQFSYDKKIKGYCKCDSCYSHIVKKTDDIESCHCEECMKHYLHGIDKKCFWCTDSTHNIADQNKSKIEYQCEDYEIIADKRTIDRYMCDSKINISEKIKFSQTINRRKKDALYQKYRKIFKKENADDEIMKEMREKNREYMQKYRNSEVCSKGEYTARKEKQKKTKEQIREEAKLRVQKSRQQMKTKYGDEKWQKIRAKEIQLGRLKAKNADEKIIEKIEKELANLKSTQ